MAAVVRLMALYELCKQARPARALSCNVSLALVWTRKRVDSEALVACYEVS